MARKKGNKNRAAAPPKYDPAPEVAAIARDLIAEHHTHLLGVRIEYVFCDRLPKNKGKAQLGNARKISSLNAFLAGKPDQEDKTTPPFFVVTIHSASWQFLKDSQRIALVDHELSHLWAEEDEDGNRKLKLLGHDLEEFAAVVRRHGVWLGDVQQFVNALSEHGQQSLDLPVGSVVDSAVRKAAERFADSVAKSGITDLTIESGGKSVTLPGGGKRRSNGGGVDVDNPLAAAAGQ